MFTAIPQIKQMNVFTKFRFLKCYNFKLKEKTLNSSMRTYLQRHIY